MLEFEVKAMLSAPEYVFLRTHYFQKSTTVTQKNYYYDTKDFELNHQGITCRIREKNGDFLATIKDHQPHGCSIETSRPVKNSCDTSFFEGMGLSLQGELITHRTSYKTETGLFMELDENRYLGTVDYELECEFDPQSRSELYRGISKLAEDMERHDIIKSAEEFQKRFTDGTSKSGRFFKRKKELQLFTKHNSILI